MIVNVCPAAVTSASPEKIWSLLTSPERYGDWLDARYVSADPPGPLQPGQVILLSTPELGREWPVRIDVRDMDPQQQFERCQRQNRFNAECQNKYHGAIVGMASTVPYGGDKFLREFERAIKEDGLKGAWITSSLQGKYPDDDEAVPFFQLAQELDVPVVIHPPRWALARSACAIIGSPPASGARWTARLRSHG